MSVLRGSLSLEQMTGWPGLACGTLVVVEKAHVPNMYPAARSLSHSG